MPSEQTYQVTIFVQTVSQRDPVEPVSLSLLARATTQDVVRAVVGMTKMASARQEAGNQWKLYETEFVRDEEHEVPGTGRKKEPRHDVSHRKLIRQLLPDEHPIIVQQTWLTQQNAENIHFYLMEVKEKRATYGAFDELRKEQCKSLPLPKLYKRLQTIDHEEAQTVDDVRRKYQNQRNMIMKRMAELS
ncbi:uncharacterized protein SPPG_04559 [Spizellomyces punctatus DAOM BR117]|uniref:SARAH domain-containing protein n=1 Tax=Spizellomyces punctatus (strain DAOM BR117) TaxID=645134 RepID=A0A0L0HHE7_SPIPD|nr:uncharacterized protein SPPG_04559 [Spizellomyces punctatus DAOM BR117]KND00224.1 hypothetical protein SPPG_04559 [Spizellomyces punctatus DAOM BR117]|eukprot:XP_016608263.1 hypothetical protein SPPG_04559 [Spizellomyces punctatus DAOM BR117]